jgi:hypothetical protein
MVVVGQEQRHQDKHKSNCTINLIAGSSGTFIFFRVAAAVVFDVSRTQTFHSVLKVGIERTVLMVFDCNRLYIHTYIHTYHIVSTNSVVQTVGHETCQKKQYTNRTYKNTTQNKTNIQMSILQTPNTCTVNNMIIE